MKLNTSLDHLPAVKRRELERVLGLIFEVFEEDTRRATALWRKQGRILKVILYGSYARGGWVDEPHTKKGYQSDFDLLIIVNRKRLSELGGVWSDVEDRLLREQLMKRLKTPVSLIVHTLDEVNTALLRGKYFFMDIYKEGRVLYEGPGRRLKTKHRSH